VPLHAGLFNIGAEGQLYLGAFAAAWIGLVLAALPGPIVVLLCATGAFLAGGAWGALAGVLRSRFGAHEVISTIMLNFVAIGLVNHAVTSTLAQPETVHTAPIPSGARLVRLADRWPAFQGSAVNDVLFVAVGVALLSAGFLYRTRLGFALRAVGGSPRAAEAGGIAPGRIQTTALLLGGGLAGLAGLNEVLGFRYYFTIGFSDGVGFMGIAVAMLGLQHPVGIIAAALLLGAVSHAGLAIGDLVPSELIGILEGLIIVMVLIAQFTLRRIERARLKARLAAQGR
jgi:simple sugar transport system permease protein